MNSLESCVIAFVSGAVSEALCVFWISASQRGDAILAAILSMLYALAIERGVGEAIHTLPGEVAFILGFGFGTFVAVYLKKFWKIKDS